MESNLPELPKKRNHKEADITPVVLKWFEENYPFSCAIEVKIKGGKAKDHQQAALKKVDKGTFSYKMPDMGRKNPFDAFVLQNAKAFVVTCDGNNCEAVEPNGSWFRFKVKR